MHQTDTPLFSPFFLSTKGTHQPTRLDTNATNRRAARAVAKNIPTTKQHTKKHTYIYLRGPALRHSPTGRGVVVGACCLPVLGAVRCRCCSFGHGASVPNLWGAGLTVCCSGNVARVAGSFAGASIRLRAVDQGLRVVWAIRRLVCWWLPLWCLCRYSKERRQTCAGAQCVCGCAWCAGV